MSRFLDHSEGAPAGDITAKNYALDPLLARKREILAWTAWLEERVEEAIAADPGLLDVAAQSPRPRVQLFSAWQGISVFGIRAALAGPDTNKIKRHLRSVVLLSKKVGANELRA